ncbi:MAG: hypothetical protein K6G43_00275 [Lachnospiraceae bacterium]|nr:hypothetical protein [Lachnospiraceae bacterium]
MNAPEIIQNIAIAQLNEMPIYDQVKKDLESIRNYQEALYVLANNPEDVDINVLRMGTVLAFRVIGKILGGKNPKDFTRDDWKDIADSVACRGVLEDEQTYTESVFDLFAAYIDYSVDVNKESISDKSAKEIKGLATEIRSQTDRLEKGEITEPYYVDECLWISFEAMIKLLAAYETKYLAKEYSEFIQAVADISVQYGRYKMYQRELALINGYLDGQKQLDDQLTAEYDRYLEDLKSESEEFNMLLDNAFSDDFESLLKNSADLARKAGVDKNQILDSKEKIDSFFL